MTRLSLLSSLKRRREKDKEEGICIMCHKLKALKGYWSCLKCRNYFKAYYKKNYKPKETRQKRFKMQKNATKLYIL